MTASQSMPYLVATERLGWPRTRWWHAPMMFFGEVQTRLRYEAEPEEPTATCHLQACDDDDALCGYPSELLIRVPRQPPWGELPQWLRCDECEAKLC